MIERCHFWFNVIEAGIWIIMAGWLLFLAGCLFILFRNRSECERVMNGKEDNTLKKV
jgi:glycerol-3-phosphate acyltransferase PlsY